MMTIGHSTLTLEAFLRALGENGCTTLVDVRRFPGSRRHPQFGQDRLFAALHEAGIRAVWREGLGGRREANRTPIECLRAIRCTTGNPVCRPVDSLTSGTAPARARFSLAT